MSKTFEVLSGCYVIFEMASSLRNDMTSSSSKCVKSRGHSPEVKFNPSLDCFYDEVKIFHRFSRNESDKG